MLFVFIVVVFATLFLASKDILPTTISAASPNSQTDWSGGTASGTVIESTTTYESASNMDTASAGEISLSEASGWATDYLSWAKRKPVTITNSGAEQTNYQVKLSITYDSDMQADFDDIRFANSSGTALDYWLQTKTDSDSATVWVEVDSLAGSDDTDIYMYYGNSGASIGSNGDNTFLFFDNFSSGSIDTDKWTLANQSDDFNITSGELVIGQGTSNWTQAMYATNSFSRSDISFEMKYRWTSNNASYDALMMGWKDDGSGSSYTNLVYGYYNSGNGSCITACPVNVYEDGNSRSPITGTWTKDTQYLTRVRMRSSGGAYYEQSTDGGSNWTTSYTSSYSTESTLHPGFTLYAGLHAFDDVRVRKWMSSEPSSSAGAEESIYSTGTLTSNVFDAEFAADWGTLTYLSSGTGTVTVKVRTDSNSDMSGATAWASCSGVSSGSDLSDTDCVTDTDQYMQYQVILAPSAANTPVFESISIAFTASDQVAPDTNATSVNITGLTNTDTWTKNEVTITWTAGADNDGGGGLAGYCIALDEVSITGSETSNVLNPATTAGSLLNAIDDGVSSSSSCGYIVAGTSVDLSSISGLTLTTGKRYYFSIKAVDLAGNVYTGASNTYQDLVDFKYDNTAPVNVSYISAPSSVFGNVADMSFNWPGTGGAASSDAHSGLLGWQYSLDEGATWRGPDTEATLGITYVDDDSSTYSYDLTEGDDGSDISEGINTIYFRTVDVAGNYSSAATYRTAPLNYGGAAPSFDVACDLPTGITISPSSSTSNSFSLSWDAAEATGENSVAGYYYMINTSPPSSLATLQSNTTQYIAASSTTVATKSLTGSVKGLNTVYVVSYDDDDNYSQSNCLKGTYTLNSTLPDPIQSLAASDASIKSDELWRASITWSAPSYKGTGTLTYIIQRSSDNSTWEEVTTTTGTAYTDTVSTSQTYYYRIGVYDTTSESQAAPTYSTSVSVYPKGTWTEAPSLSGDPVVSAVTTKKATISWSTSRTADSKIQYGDSSGSYFDEEPSKSDQVTSHELNLTNLSPGTKYYYRVKWTDEDGNTGTSSEQVFTTDPAPAVSSVEATNVSLTSAFIKFSVSNAVKVTVQYGISTAYGGTQSTTTATSDSTYSVQLTELSDGTKYHYRLVMEDSEGDEYFSDDYYDLETLPRPRISNITLQEISGTAQPTALVEWQTNTEVSSIITYYPEGRESEARDEVNVNLRNGSHKMVLQGLLPQTRYVLLVKGRDKIGNEAVADPQFFTTATDTRPPQIVNLNLEGTTQQTPTGSGGQESLAQMIVTWDTDEPSTSQVEIGEGSGSDYSQSTQEDTSLTTNHMVIISNLTPSKVYHLRAISKDSIGNQGNSLDTVTITPKSTDSAFDLVVGNLSELFGFLKNN